MNSEKIERLAVDAVKSSLYETDRLMPDIDENDRSPSWDGDVRVYQVKNSNKKADLKGLVRVQVKGHTVKRSVDDQHSKFSEEIKFDVEVADLKNYLSDQGVIFFVVYIDLNSNEKKIYFCDLLPLSLANIIQRATGEKIRLDFIEFPDINSEKVDIFLNFITNRNIQGDISGNGVRSEEVLKKCNLIDNYVIRCVTSETPKDATDLLFKPHKKFVYAETPVGLLALHEVTDFRITKTDLPVQISVAGKVYFEKITFEKSKDGLVWIIGNSIRLEMPTETKKELSLECKLQGSLKEQIYNLEFIQSFCRVGAFEIDGCKLGLGDGNEFEHFLSVLPTLQKLQSVLDVLGVELKTDVDVDYLRDNEEIIQKLWDGLINHKTVDLENLKASVLYLEIALGAFSLLVAARKCPDGKYYLEDLFKKEITADIKFDEKEYVVSKYVFLEEKQLVSCINIHYDEILKGIMQIGLTPVSAAKNISLFLRMLSAYDKQAVKNPELLETAVSLADYFYKNEQNNINLLNYCQVLTRKQELPAAEKRKLSELLGSPSALVMEKLAAAILLEDFEQAEKFYQQLSEAEKKDFDGFPINNLWKKEKNDEKIENK